MPPSSTAPPTVFISYAWEGQGHRQWVKELAYRLRVDGINLLLDQWELWPGDQLPEFMEKSIRVSDTVVIVCTEAYKEKSDLRTGGVGYEGSVITAEVSTGAPRRKFIPILRRGEWRYSAPSWLLGSVYIDFRGSDDELEIAYSDLLQTLLGRRESAPPIGSPPFPELHNPKIGANRSEPRTPLAETSEVSISGRNSADSVGVLGQSPNDPAWPQVWNTLMRERPGDDYVAALGRRWLENAPADNPGWAYVWNALMRERPGDDYVAALGRRWLEDAPADNPGWAHVWNTLMRERPGDDYVAALGRRWLEDAPADNPGWAHVWNALMRERPGDDYVAALGRRWLEEVPPKNPI